MKQVKIQINLKGIFKKKIKATKNQELYIYKTEVQH